MSKLSPLDLRIKSAAAFTCDLSTRLEASSSVGRSAPHGFATDAHWIGAVERPWMRRFAYGVFALAITLPWVLFLADQIFG